MILVAEFSIPAERKDDPIEYFGSLHEGALIVRILRRSVDARNRSKVIIRYRAEVSVPDIDEDYYLSRGFVHAKPDVAAENFSALFIKPSKHVVVVGSGPAGLFCALRLVERGVRVTLLERGKCVEERMLDIEKLEAEGVLDVESNSVFGEGGAGTYSDGKLTSRIHRGEIGYFFTKIAEFGADEKILYDAKPHVGTDNLSKIVRNIRQSIVEKGSVVRFGAKVDGFKICNGKAEGVFIKDEFIACDAVILATGHSARDTYRDLFQSGIRLEKKGFAVGTRVEHPADFINRNQYGRFADFLPAADYHLAYNDAVGRGTYTFCMCPGGYVINSSSENGLLCVNGMSNSKRDNNFSNAALVVSVQPEDISGDVFAAMEFQRDIERKAFNETGSFVAPFAYASSFFGGKKKDGLPKTSYRMGVKHSDFKNIFPDFVMKGIVSGLADFDRKIRGFIDNAVLIGAETRTSSPVRILRDLQCRCEGFDNIYAAGEGSGYSGGIVSSAVDGIRAADSVCASMQ